MNTGHCQIPIFKRCIRRNSFSHDFVSVISRGIADGPLFMETNCPENVLFSGEKLNPALGSPKI